MQSRTISTQRFVWSLVFLTIGLAIPFFFHRSVGLLLPLSGIMLTLSGMIFNWEHYKEPIKLKSEWNRKDFLWGVIMLAFLGTTVFVMKKFPSMEDFFAELWFKKPFLFVCWILLLGVSTNRFLKNRRNGKQSSSLTKISA